MPSRDIILSSTPALYRCKDTMDCNDLVEFSRNPSRTGKNLYATSIDEVGKNTTV